MGNSNFPKSEKGVRNCSQRNVYIQNCYVIYTLLCVVVDPFLLLHNYCVTCSYETAPKGYVGVLTFVAYQFLFLEISNKVFHLDVDKIQNVFLD